MQKISKSGLCVASFLALALAAPVPARADDAAMLKSLQEQITALQKQVAKLQAAQATSEKAAKKALNSEPAPTQAARVAPAAPAPTPVAASSAPAPATVAAASAATPAKDNGLKGMIKAKTGVDITLGGFVDLTGVYRSKNQSADTGSNFNTMIPFNNAANAHRSEFRESARATRLSLLATGNPDASTKLTAYFETDFQGTGTGSTQTQTNSFVPRLRQAFGSYEDNALGLHLTAGQTWSLATMSSAGIDPLKPVTPMVLDSGFLPGFTYTRVPQVRIAKDFADKKLWVALSAESPQAVTGGICTAGGATATIGNSPSTGTSPCYSAGNVASRFNSSYLVSGAAFTGNLQGSITTDVAPDVLLKVAYDPGWGHYEVFGVTRFFRDTVGSSYHNNYAMGAGVGAGAVLPVVAKKLDVTASVMAGKGIGRYSSAQMPDFSIAPDGDLKPLSQYSAILGIIGHPTPAWDTFLFAGMEQTFRHSEPGIINNAYGYGNFGVDNSNCYEAGNTSCYAQTSSTWQITPGVWHRVYDGNYGKMQLGLQYSWTRRNAFSDSNGVNPHGIENIALFTIRYTPF
jgi:hypothetical protein